MDPTPPPTPTRPPAPDSAENQSGSHRTGTQNTGTQNTGTGTVSGQTRMDATAFTLSTLTGADDAPDLAKISGWRLQSQLLAGTILLVVVVVALSGGLSILSAQRQFKETAEFYTQRFEEQAREIGATISHTVSLSSAGSLRDNNYGMLVDTVRDITRDNPNITRLRVLDAEGQSVADSEPNAVLGTVEQRKSERSWTTSAHHGRPVFEYQEPVDYGSSSGKGIVVLSYSLEELQRRLAELETAKRTAESSITRRTAVLALAFILLGMLVSALQSRRVSRSLEALTQGAMRFAAGDLAVRVDQPKGGAREVRTLAAVFNYMGDRLRVLLESVRNKAVLEREVELARQVQSSLLPSREPVLLGPVRLAGACLNADACGGDWWIHAVLDRNKVVIGIGDVTGHGLSTALIATSATSGFAAAMKLRETGTVSAEFLISSLNQTLFSVAHGQHQMSTALAILNTETGELEYAAGGHPPAGLINRAVGQFSSLPVRGALLGADERSTYSARKGQLKSGDLIVWYTDGLTEARGADGKLYGLQRLGTVLARSLDLSVEQIRDAIMSDVQAYSEGREQQDDITVVVLEYSGSSAMPRA